MKNAATAEKEVRPAPIHVQRPVRRNLRAVARSDAPMAFMPELDKVQAILDENQRLKQELAELRRSFDALRQLAWGSFT